MGLFDFFKKKSSDEETPIEDEGKIVVEAENTDDSFPDTSTLRRHHSSIRFSVQNESMAEMALYLAGAHPTAETEPAGPPHAQASVPNPSIVLPEAPHKNPVPRIHNPQKGPPGTAALRSVPGKATHFFQLHLF